MPRGRKSKALQEIEDRIDASVEFTEAEKEEIRIRAREEVAEARKKAATEKLFAAYKKEEEQEHEPTEAYEDFTVDLPTFAPMIKINGVGFYHGLTYEVPYSKARAMADIQWSAWQHQNEIDGHSRHGDLQRKPHLAVMNMATGAVTNGNVTTAGGMRNVR